METANTMQSTFEVISFIASIASLILAIVAIWLSIVFFKMSDQAAKETTKSSDKIQSSVDKLEKLFDKLYSDTFSIVKDTVSDMRQTLYSIPENKDTEEQKLNSVKENINNQISELLKSQDVKIEELEKKLKNVVDKQIDSYIDYELAEHNFNKEHIYNIIREMGAVTFNSLLLFIELRLKKKLSPQQVYEILRELRDEKSVIWKEDENIMTDSTKIFIPRY